MDRRSFHKAVGLSILGAGAIGPARAWTAPDGGREAVRRRAGEDHKAWARKHFRGMENLFLPSFTADFAQLDEEGIRADVRQAARQGFFSTLPVNLGLKSRDESRRLLEIVADEARGKILVTAGVSGRYVRRTGGRTPVRRASRRVANLHVASTRRDRGAGRHRGSPSD